MRLLAQCLPPAAAALKANLLFDRRLRDFAPHQIVPTRRAAKADRPQVATFGEECLPLNFDPSPYA